MLTIFHPRIKTSVSVQDRHPTTRMVFDDKDVLSPYDYHKRKRIQNSKCPPETDIPDMRMNRTRLSTGTGAREPLAAHPWGVFNHPIHLLFRLCPHRHHSQSLPLLRSLRSHSHFSLYFLRWCPRPRPRPSLRRWLLGPEYFGSASRKEIEISDRKLS